MPRRDNLTDTPRTKAWAWLCRNALNAKSWYVVENALEAEARRRDVKGRICQRGKWPDYAQGIHVPQKRLVAQVELSIPGSAEVLNHPIWKIRDLPPEKAAQTATQFLRALSPDVRQRLFHGTDGLSLRRKRITTQTLIYLDTRHNLCGLGALAMIVLEASGNENKRLAFQAGCVLFRALLRLQIESPPWLAQIAADLFELFRQRVFPHAADRELRMRLEGADFHSLAYDRTYRAFWTSPVEFLISYLPTERIRRHRPAQNEEPDNRSLLITRGAKGNSSGQRKAVRAEHELLKRKVGEKWPSG